MNKANLFVVGAPKCGTTTLCAILSAHPDIYVNPRKEIHYFNLDGMRSCTSIEEYESLFSCEASEARYYVDGSTHYLFSEVAARQIIKYNPGAKFIVCLRNPIDMAPSLHAERVWQGMENIPSFSEAWRLRGRRGAGNVPAVMRGHEELLNYESMCRLGSQLERLKREVPEGSLMVILLDDLKSDRESVLNGLARFLGINSSWLEEGEVLNERKAVRRLWVSVAVRRLANLKKLIGIKRGFGLLSYIQFANTKKPDHVPIDDLTFQDMKAAFEGEIVKLEKILDRDLGWWRKECREL